LLEYLNTFQKNKISETSGCEQKIAKQKHAKNFQAHAADLKLKQRLYFISLCRLKTKTNFCKILLFLHVITIPHLL